MNKTFNIAISLTKNDYAEFELRPPINMISGDHGTNVLKFTVYDEDGAPVNLTGMIAKITCKCPSGTSQQQNLTISSPTQGKMEAVLEQRFFAEGGTYQAEVQLYSSSDLKVRNTLPRFTYDVDKSLLEDARVVANEQFSILQQMVDTVATAEVRSVEALDTATRAMGVANQKGDVATEQAARAEREANRSRDEANRAWQADFAKHTTLDSEIQQNIDFMGREVVQDGLVNVVYKQQGLVDTGLKLDNNTIIISVKASEDGTFQNAYYCGTYASDGSGWMLKKQGVNWMVYANGKNIENQKLAFEIKDNVEIIISTHNKSYNIFIDGKKLASFFDTNSVINFYYNGTFSTGACSKYISTNSINVYNRQLTPQEIAHNFQVLNNSPSINGITTTDNTGKSSILSLATDSRHVVMDNGFNQEEAYTGVLKTMAKDFVADAQGKITVSNGLSCGKVLGLTMSGQTAKNVITSPYNSNRNGWNDVGLFDAIVSGSSITQTSTSGNPAKIRLSKESPFVLNNTYYLTACVENATSATKNGHFNIYIILT